MTNELNALVNELNFKKEVLDTKTTSIVEGIKDWCCKEYARINGEFDELKGFVGKNINLIHRGMYCHSWSNGSRYSWGGIEIEYEDGIVKGIGLDSDYMYKKHFGYMWSDLPKPSHYDNYRFFAKTDMDNKDVTYWTDYKGWLAIYNELLTETTKRLKAYLGTLILEQDKRFEDMNKACREIDDCKTETIEIKVEVRV